MKKLLILLVCCLTFSACTHEKEAQELYSKATGMKLNAQYSEAIPLYKEVISKYPRSSVINSATSDLTFCEKRVVEQKIEHNTPIILKAVNEFPARKLPATQKGTMPLGKSIFTFKELQCNLSKKQLNKAYGFYEILAARLMTESACSYRVGKWQVQSSDNISYVVSKTSRGKTLDGDDNEMHYTYIIDIGKETITATDMSSCYFFGSEALEKANEGDKEDYSKCSFPIKLKGVLK